MLSRLNVLLMILVSIMTIKVYGAEKDEVIDATFARVAREQEVPEKLLKAICWSESKFDSEAFNFGDGSGTNHAFGICQVLYNTAKGFGLNDVNCYKDFSRLKAPLGIEHKISRGYKDCKLFGIYTNMTYAAKYLKLKLDSYDNSWISGTAAYNSGSLKTCKSGLVHRAKDHSVLYTCKKGGLLNQKYVDRVFEALAQQK